MHQLFTAPTPRTTSRTPREERMHALPRGRRLQAPDQGDVRTYEAMLSPEVRDIPGMSPSLALKQRLNSVSGPPPYNFYLKLSLLQA
jgi:hypothetical protein